MGFACRNVLILAAHPCLILQHCGQRGCHAEAWHLSYLNLSHTKSPVIPVWGSDEAGGEEPATNGLWALRGHRCGGLNKTGESFIP